MCMAIVIKSSCCNIWLMKKLKLAAPCYVQWRDNPWIAISAMYLEYALEDARKVLEMMLKIREKMLVRGCLRRCSSCSLAMINNGLDLKRSLHFVHAQTGVPSILNYNLYCKKKIQIDCVRLYNAQKVCYDALVVDENKNQKSSEACRKFLYQHDEHSSNQQLASHTLLADLPSDW